MSTKESEIRKYLEEKVDPFLKPLLLDLMKNKPGEVYDHIKNWIDSKGKQINDNLHKKQETEQSHHYDNLKKSVATIPNLDNHQEIKAEVSAGQDETNQHTHQDGTSHSHIGGDQPHEHQDNQQSQSKVSQKELGQSQKGEEGVDQGGNQQDGSAPAPVKEGGFDPEILPKSTTQLPDEPKQESKREISQSQANLNNAAENQPQEDAPLEAAKQPQVSPDNQQENTTEAAPPAEAQPDNAQAQEEKPAEPQVEGENKPDEAPAQ